MTENCDKVVNLVRSLIALENQSEDIIEETVLEEYIERVKSIIKFTLSEDEIDSVRKALHHMSLVRMSRGIKIVNEPDYKDWYSPYNIKEGSYWKRYKSYLAYDLSFPERVIDAIDSSTTDIVNLLGKPEENSMFSRKGLVIGDVQSGKTANYISVINKAADAGYKVIILLTGTIEKLRQQTQARVDEGFIGIDTSALERRVDNRPIGVSTYDSTINVGSFTSVIKDFNKSLLRTSIISTNTLSVPFIIVAKKNKAVLDSIFRWFNREQKNLDSNKINQSLLFIDDEADNASINTNSQDTDPTSINKCIRRILNLFMRSSYVGYTATPYANVFIEPSTKENMEDEDLFPKDYIYVLASPSNYIGAREIYSEDGKYKSMYRVIDDFESFLPLKHKKDYELPLDLPLSLKKAILSFLIVNAIRDLRQDVTAHRSMLINVSRFICIQNDLKDIVNVFLNSVKDKVQNYILSDDYNRYPLLEMLESVYKSEFKETSQFKETIDINWDSIRKQLFDSIKSIKVESVNGGNASKLLDYKSYQNGLRIIAIGGLSLSRGLTLEGLCVSYFHRNSIMYDTLMQMGRWFGYRTKYEDLCQIWMSEESYNWYEHISEATDELRMEINRIHYSNLTPIDVGIRVRGSEGALIVTAKNKMRSASDYIADLSLNGNYIETPYFSKNSQIINGNIEVVKNLLNALQSKGYKVADPKELSLEYKTAKQILNVKKELIVEFLKQIDTHHRNIKFDAQKIAELIESSDEEILNTWDIVFPKGESHETFNVLGQTINRITRTPTRIENNLIVLKKSRLGSPGIGKSGLTKAEYKELKKLLEKRESGLNSTRSTISDKDYFDIDFKRRPLLIVYLIDLKVKENDVLNQPLVGLAVGIPRLKEPKALNYTYKVNSKWLKDHFSVDEDDISELDDIGDCDD